MTSFDHPRRSLETAVAILSASAIGLHLLLRYALAAPPGLWQVPLIAVLVLGGVPLTGKVLAKFASGEFGSDLLAAISILTSVLMGQYLVGAILVLMLSGGGALETFATRRASRVLHALAKRMPHTAHRKRASAITDAPAAEIAPGETVVVLPHEICPVDGLIVEGRGTMDESYLTGEPFEISKTVGSQALSGAVNGERALTIVAQRPAADSRYARIMRVMEDTERNRPRLRRLADQLAAWYIPLVLTAAVAAWLSSADPVRFLSVLVIATPCPLLIAIPVAIIGAVSLAGARSIVVKNPAVLEQITRCRTVILDKTGTLTFGKPSLTEIVAGPGFNSRDALRSAAALEQYSRHPLAAPIVKAASEAGLTLPAVGEASEKPGAGLTGTVEGRRIKITGRKIVDAAEHALPPAAEGPECLVFIDDAFAAALRFHDAPRPESRSFLSHLPSAHQITKIMLVSGDRESEVRYLARSVDIADIAAEKSPEEKVAIVREQMKTAKTLFVGDGINDAPALAAATVGVAIGQNSDITSEAAGAVIMTSELGKIDELIHIGRRMRAIALQSAVGGMALSLVGMILASMGRLTPLEGAAAQEIIDVLAVFNAIRAAFPPRKLTDF